MLPKFRILLAGLLAVVANKADAISLNFSNVAGASIEFNGTTDAFSFKDNTVIPGPSLNRDFQVTSVTDGLGSSLGLFGNISGSFTIGAVNTVGTKQTAPVTSVGGVFSIFDGVASLVANIAWIDIYTDGSTGGINAGGTVNLSSITYLGANPDLIALKGGTSTGIASLSFQFIPARSLAELTTNGAINQTSYSGSAVSTVPDGASYTVMLLGLSMIGLELLRRRKALVQ